MTTEERQLRVFDSFRDADEAEDDEYRAMSPERRFQLVLELSGQLEGENDDEAAERRPRVLRVLELE